MEKQITAVEWLLENINSQPHDEEDFKYNEKCWNKAEEMEKEQMKESFIVALDMLDFTILSNSTINESFEDYYNQTFKNK